jgi:DNA gyrase/topoisomerase IV subunit A
MLVDGQNFGSIDGDEDSRYQCVAEARRKISEDMLNIDKKLLTTNLILMSLLEPKVLPTRIPVISEWCIWYCRRYSN